VVQSAGPAGPPFTRLTERAAFTAFVLRPRDWRSFLSSANGRPAPVHYRRPPGGERYGATVDVYRIVDGRIVEDNAFHGAHHAAVFGIPQTLAP
jgi:RNA polymerase sigma-70 factor (ECF subfamily)